MHDQQEYLNDWWSQPPGCILLNAEISAITARASSLSGNYALLLGCNAQLPLLAPIPCLKKLIVATTFAAARTVNATIQATFESLPVKDNSVDILLAPHLFDSLTEINPLLIDEIYRIVKPEGQFILLGLTPSGIWNLWRHYYPQQSKPLEKQCSDCISTLRTAFLNRHCQLIAHHTILYQLPQQNTQRWLRIINFSLRQLKRIAPWLGGIFLLQFKKKIMPVNPLPLLWSSASNRLDATPEASANIRYPRN